MSTRALAISVAAAASLLALPPAPVFPLERAFDLDTGNAPHDVVIPTALPPLRATVSSSDASLVLHMTVQLNNAWFDAIAPPTAPRMPTGLAGSRPGSSGSRPTLLSISRHCAWNLVKPLVGSSHGPPGVSSTGLMIAHYERAGEIKIGDTALETPSKAEEARRERMKREG